jgi:glycosyltransferase involved in cell wall biosynthesis
MKIVHFLNHTLRANGHVCVAVDLACEQALQGHEVHLASDESDYEATFAKNGVTFHRIDASGPRPVQLLRMWLGLIAVSRRVRPDVVNAHMVAAAVAARLAKPFAKFRLVTTVHNSFDPQSNLMGLGDRVIAVSEAVKNEMAAKGVPAQKIDVVLNGTIGGVRRPSVPVQKLELQHPSITTVAGLHPRKGIGDLLQAFALVSQRHPHAHLYLVGEGPCQAQYEAQTNALPCRANVHFLGFMEDPRAALAATDIFVLASHAEPYALVLSEARQMGCAMIGTRVGGTPEALGFGEKGVLVPPQDPAALAEAIAALLDDETRRLSLANAAMSDLDDFTVRSMSRRTVEVYRKALGRR